MTILIEWNNGTKFPISTNLSRKDAQALAKRLAKETDDVRQISVDDYVVVKIEFGPPSPFMMKTLSRERKTQSASA